MKQERISAATSRENAAQTNQNEQTGGELAAAPCSARRLGFRSAAEALQFLADANDQLKIQKAESSRIMRLAGLAN